MPDPTERLINPISPIGAAYPPGSYPNPVKTKRTTIIALQKAEANGADMWDQDEVIAGIGDNAEAIDWVQKNWDEYKEGLDGRGFEVKRYRIAMYFTTNPRAESVNIDTTTLASNQDKQVLVLRESEDSKTLVDFATDMIRTYQSRGWVTKSEPDKSTGIYREVLTVSGKELKLYCKLKVSVIRPLDFTPARDTRYASPDDIQRQKDQTKLVQNEMRATAG